MHNNDKQALNFNLVYAINRLTNTRKDDGNALH